MYVQSLMVFASYNFDFSTSGFYLVEDVQIFSYLFSYLNTY